LEFVIVAVIIPTILIILIGIIIIYKLLRDKFQSIDTINDSAIKLDTTVSSIEKLNATLFNQVDDLRKLGMDLKFNFQNFYDMLIMKPTVRGQVGEGIVKFILSSFPERLWKEQYHISGSGVVDFAIFLPPDDKILPMDAKFSMTDAILPQGELREGEIIFLNKEQRNKANSLVIKRMKEIIKYIKPLEGTMNFALIFIPDSIFLAITSDTLNELRSNRVIPVNTSGLISTLFLIERQYNSIKISEAVNRLDEIISTTQNQFLDISNILSTAEKQSQNTNNNVRKAIRSLKVAENKILESFNLLE
jgi:DNA anti-recombination protein RmuC